jgi:glycosyltransferase involved in cell wall biosynthesis
MIQITLLARRMGLRTILRGELTDVPPGGNARWYHLVFKERFLSYFYRQVDAFCYVGETSKSHLQRRGIPSDSLFYSPYSVDTEHFEQMYRAMTREEARRALGFSDNEFVVLYSGKMALIKDPMLLLRAVKLLENPANLRLVMLGTGELYEELKKTAFEILGDRQQLPGFVNQTKLGAYYRAADVLVVPSLSETWGLVVNECMQFGVPSIATSTAGCAPDLVIPGETGEVFEQGDPNALAACLAKMMGDRERRRWMAKNARAHVSRYTALASAKGIAETAGLGA